MLALKQGHISSLQGIFSFMYFKFLLTFLYYLILMYWNIHFYCNVNGFQTGYLSSTMQAITEAWESILLEMDSKLASYAATVADGSVAADFLDLLMLGVPSSELELFLQRDLTEKGLKKLSHSIELSYSNIQVWSHYYCCYSIIPLSLLAQFFMTLNIVSQKFVLKHIHCVGTSVSFHLTELRGMARHVERFAPLGLTEETVAASLSAAGAFLVKATEVQQVIENSMKKFKAFFRWLLLVGHRQIYYRTSFFIKQL